ncbi:hypothetical protein PIB30_037556, partial [Stylosanthes scabra]|nr:hypothetical protein [Stylosanthes scabra]
MKKRNISNSKDEQEVSIDNKNAKEGGKSVEARMVVGSKWLVEGRELIVEGKSDTLSERDK